MSSRHVSTTAYSSGVTSEVTSFLVAGFTYGYLDFSYYPTRIACRHAVGGNVVSDYTARPYHCAVADGHSRAYRYVASKPAVNTPPP